MHMKILMILIMNPDQYRILSYGVIDPHELRNFSWAENWKGVDWTKKTINPQGVKLKNNEQGEHTHL